MILTLKYSIIFLAYVSLVSATKFVIFGSTGKTGLKIMNKFNNMLPDSFLVAPVRSMSKGRALLGADSKTLSLIPCDLNCDNKEKLMSIVKDADAVVICSASSPGNKGLPDIKGSYRIDNLGSKLIIDACVASNVPKVVLVSSLLTNGFRAGQFLNPQYLLLNAFGGALLQKREAEIYLQKQNATIDYTIIRPGGLKDSPPSVPILYGCADALFGGSISREQVAEVVVISCTAKEASNKIVEIVATGDARQVTPQQGLESVR